MSVEIMPSTYEDAPVAPDLLMVDNANGQESAIQPYAIAVTGGGNGMSSILRTIRESLDERAAEDPRALDASLVGLVTVVDEGGSTGRLSRQFGTLPVGDLRRGLSALTDEPVAEVFERRFGPDDSPETVRQMSMLLVSRLVEIGHDIDNDRTAALIDTSTALAESIDSVEGHAYGNLLLTAEARRLGTMSAASDSIGEFIGARGNVWPVSEVPHRLVAFDSGVVHVGEHVIDDLTDADFINPASIEVKVTPDMSASSDQPNVRPVPVNPVAEEFLYRADVVVTGLGSQLTSVDSANHVLSGSMLEADASIIHVVNPVVQPETRNMTATQSVERVRSYAGKVDMVVLHDDPADIVGRGLEPLPHDLAELAAMPAHAVRPVSGEVSPAIVPLTLVSKESRTFDENDALAASRSRLVLGPALGSLVIEAVQRHRQKATSHDHI